MSYPATKDLLHPATTSDREQILAIKKMQDRVGTLRDPDAASIEDRLFTMENLLLDALARIHQPPGQVKK